MGERIATRVAPRRFLTGVVRTRDPAAVLRGD